ncbi:MAG TPA: FkbM family methyltransferase [Candidatus Limnocylindrales bacterium]
MSHSDSLRRRPTVAYDDQRSRVPLHPVTEAAARIAYGWLRNQHHFRDRRPVPGFFFRSARFLRLRDRQPTVDVDMAGLRVLVSTSDLTIARSVYISGDWDPLMVGAVFDALDRYGQPYRGRTFVEVGANFGVYALPAVSAHGFGRAVAYEPDPFAFELLTCNIERNKLTSRVSAYNLALSAEPGELTLQLGNYNAGDNRIVGNGSAPDAARVVPVPARTFDVEVAAGHIPIDDLGLAWIDVQGHELEVLRGAASLLAARVPLVIEYGTEMMSTADRRALEDLLAEHYAVMVDLGWCALTNRLRFQPASAIRRLARDGRPLETDLLLLPERRD